LAGWIEIAMQALPVVAAHRVHEHPFKKFDFPVEVSSSLHNRQSQTMRLASSRHTRRNLESCCFNALETRRGRHTQVKLYCRLTARIVGSQISCSTDWGGQLPYAALYCVPYCSPW
jgi:hypothetical protein